LRKGIGESERRNPWQTRKHPENGIWKMQRTRADFSPFEFSQRFSGTFADGGKRVDGIWEIAHDHRTWEKDFDLIYTRVA